MGLAEKGRSGPWLIFAILMTATRAINRIRAILRRIVIDFGRIKRKGFIGVCVLILCRGFINLVDSIERSKVVVKVAAIIFFISSCWLG